MYIFPGLALGAHLGKTGTVTDMMIQTSAEALPELITPEDLRLGYVFPRLSDARHAMTLAVCAPFMHLVAYCRVPMLQECFCLIDGASVSGNKPRIRSPFAGMF